MTGHTVRFIFSTSVSSAVADVNKIGRCLTGKRVLMVLGLFFYFVKPS